jgi:hypothetical protein
MPPLSTIKSGRAENSPTDLPKASGVPDFQKISLHALETT